MKRIVCFHSLYSDVDFGVTTHLVLEATRKHLVGLIESEDAHVVWARAFTRAEGKWR